jgi:hypothetical protein
LKVISKKLPIDQSIFLAATRTIFLPGNESGGHCVVEVDFVSVVVAGINNVGTVVEVVDIGVIVSTVC